MANIIMGVLVTLFATGILLIASENTELKKEVQVQNEIIKACEADRIRLLNQ